jgi:hypothetical protein
VKINIAAYAKEMDVTVFLKQLTLLVTSLLMFVALMV